MSQYRLATHLVLALVIFAAIVWTLRRMGGAPAAAVSPSLKVTSLKITSHILLAVTFLQIYFGALVAGLRAGRVYNTWPDIDGAFIPAAERLFFETPWWRNLFDNALTVQFEHRMTAYVLLALALFHALDAMRGGANRAVVAGAWGLFAAMMLQAVLGVLTLLNQVPIDLALSHQAVAIIVLTLAVVQMELLSPRRIELTAEKLAAARGPDERALLLVDEFDPHESPQYERMRLAG